MDGHHLETRVLATLTVAFVLAGCAGGPAESATQTLATAQPTATGVPSVPATPALTVLPTATAAATAAAGRVGATWRAVPDVPAHWGMNASAVTGGLGGWVALGGAGTGSAPTVWTSADGMAWQPGATLPLPAGVTSDTIVAATTFGADVYGLGVTGDFDAIVWRSEAGGAWKVIGSGALFDLGPCPAGCASVRSIAVNRAGVVLAGYRVKQVGDGFDLETDFWHTQDGSSWTRTAAPVPAGSTDRPAAEVTVASMRGGFVAAGTLCDKNGTTCRSVTWTSVDGRTWPAPANLPGGNEVRAEQIAVGLNSAVIVGMRCTTGCRLVAWHSTDAASWALADLDGPYAEASTELAAASDTFVLVTSVLVMSPDDAKARVWTSTDGAHWASIAVLPGLDPAQPLGQILDLAGRADGLLAMGLISSEAGGEGLWISP